MTGRPDDGSHDARNDAVTVDTGATSSATPASIPFTPGSVVAGRYRLVALLGRGGMAEVYRADDLTLNQPVALKFLPRVDAAAGGADEAARLERLHNELRVARQVSHKNVCRLYDLGDADGRRFLTMEYVDGEDLASLLRRIGRIPQDKAIQIARQLCAAVAAAHERGVLHRDLKPANVMIDGDGNVRVTDFGIATATGDAGTDVAGTPQYMAPEQFSGRPASTRSDIYSLGLVLFEVFTGRRAYDARTLGEVKQLHETATVTTPSSIVRDLDPAVERVILRCLEKDPDRRPSSALTVAAALPGGDPLAAALAAGETPSPDLLVAAGETEAFAVRPALAMALAFVAVLLLFAGLASRASIAGLVPMDKPRDVLADRVEQVIAAIGHDDPIADRADGFAVLQDYLRWAQRSGTADWWGALRSGEPAALLYWTRTSPRDMVPTQPGGAVTLTDPPMNVSGMHQIFLDTRGRLVEFHSVPRQIEKDVSASGSPPWQKLFDAAGLDFASFAAVAPEWTPRDFADTRAAWEGPLSGRPDIRVRVEAAAFRGRPVSFQIVGPWTQATRMQAIQRSALQSAAAVLSGTAVIGLIGGALFLAWYNLRTNRADRRSAARLAIGLAIAETVGRLLGLHHVATPDVELRRLLTALVDPTFDGAFVWVFYLAIEPYARRLWPDGLLGSTRLLSGHVRDSRVGRDVLVGLTFAAAWLLVSLVGRTIHVRLGYTAVAPPFGDAVSMLLGASTVVPRWAAWLNESLQDTMLVAMVLIVTRLALRRPGLALVASIVAITLIANNGGALTDPWIDIATQVSIAALFSYAAFRYGLLVLFVALLVGEKVKDVPLTLHASVWWATASNVTIAMCIALAAFAYVAARAGQPLFGRAFSD
jgi:serine/threonine-protein kinase